MHYFVMDITNKLELKKIALYNSSGIDIKDLMNLYKICTAKPYSSLVIDANFATNNSLRFTKNVVKRNLKN